ncbi:phosphoribosylamine--glycine ligase [bacterium BMS3Abin05]|nr:phosphoribosylamine--glycine ligase [bacterium BMS3Abin05]GBE27641.1 phosphoribosylamine--glycine ligase [bacterium BMS3Bbin03]HDZ11207.1 phosphoribosylamine--glycine ligase [Bacteroidota bacterium]
MKVLVIGNGGREHALVWKLAQNPAIDRLYCAPGNPGIEAFAECAPIRPDDLQSLLQFAKEKSIDFTVVGPELPLVHGIADMFQKEGLKLFGPSRGAARIEGSKSFAKDFMQRYHIPTAGYEVFKSMANARNYIWNHEGKLVVKADGLAAGKGSLVCETKSDAQKALEEMMLRNVFGEAGHRVVIEEFLEGDEVSVLAFSDGKTVLPLIPAQDHKAVFDNDLGPNTGGMGAYAPVPFVNEKLLREIRETVLEPTIRGMAKDGNPYKGILYAGLMLTEEGPKVIEFNCRFGDPESQAILPLLKSDLLEGMMAVVNGNLADYNLEIEDRSAVCVIMASEGYPGPYEKGKEITGLDSDFGADTIIFHAGTKRVNGKLLTNGGRVLGVTHLAQSLKDAIEGAYKAVKSIFFEGAYYRTDIGKKGLRNI